MSTADLPPEIRPLIEAIGRFHDAYQARGPVSHCEETPISRLLVTLADDQVGAGSQVDVLAIVSLSPRAQELLVAAIDLATVELQAQQFMPDPAFLADFESAFTAEDHAAHSTFPFDFPLNDEPDGGQQA